MLRTTVLEIQRLRFLFHYDVNIKLTLEYGTDRLSRNVGKKITTTRCVIAYKSAALPYRYSCPCVYRGMEV